MAEKSCLRCLSIPRPEVLLVGPIAAIRQRQEEIKLWDDWDERAYGIITSAMRDCTSAKVRLSQIPRDNIGCGHHAAAALATLAQKFDLVDLRTEANRRIEFYEAKLGRNQSITDFASILRNLRSRLLQLNADAVDEAQAIIRLIDGLMANGEIMVQTLAQGISTAMLLNPNLTFDAACNMAIGFDNTPVGRERLRGGGHVMALQCHNCQNMGHISRDCPAPHKRSAKKVAALNSHYGPVDSVGAAGTTQRGSGVICSHCHREGHEEPNCFIAHPEKKDQWRKARSAKRTAYRSNRETGGKATGKGNPNYPAGKGGKSFKPPSFNKSGALTVVGATVQDLEQRIVVDTGASEDIMILRDVDHFSVVEDGLSYVGTASEGSVLQILGTGTAGRFNGVLLAPTAAFNLASGSRVRSRGLLFVDSVPPVLVDTKLRVVLTGKHVFGLPSFPLREFLDLPLEPGGTQRA